MPIAKEDEKRDLTLAQLRKRTLKAGQIKDFDSVLAVLKDAYSCDFTDEEAAHEAGIDRTTLQRWRRESPEFDAVIRQCEDDMPRMMKRQIRKFMKDDKQFTQWYAEHGKPKRQYSSRVETTGPEGKEIEVSLTKFQKDELDQMTDAELQQLVADQVKREAEGRGRS